MGDLPSKPYYTAQRQRGHTHGRALRAVADRLLRILVAMLTTRTLFDCSKARPPQLSNPSEKVASASCSRVGSPLSATQSAVFALSAENAKKARIMALDAYVISIAS